jgi:moderate conductance mechanosensitive channel
MNTNDIWLFLRDLALLLAIVGGGMIAVNFLMQRLQKRLRVAQDMEGERRQQLETILHTLRWVVQVLIVALGLLILLEGFVDIRPLLASVGVAGLALSLGAQTLIKDLIGGVLVLIENQYGIGDVIQVQGISGAVERLTLRTTWVRGISGELHIIPNGEVRIVSNVTRDWSRALVDVGIAYEEDLDRALQVLEDAAQAFAQDPEFAPYLLEPPQVLGPLDLGDWAVTVRVMAKTRPGKHWEVTRALKKRVLAACEREDITLPYPRQEMLVRTSGMDTF